jgi:3-deoxy-manno-octulosonate cytidylyltransferase (CMP-KDO synthetase)
MATLAVPFTRAEDFCNPNQVKVVLGLDSRALYFSRAPIPYPRDLGPGQVGAEWFSSHPVLRHLGLYAYQAATLEAFTRWPTGRLEAIEKLEQLRVLENGGSIGVDITRESTIGVDTLEDAVRFEQALASG